MGKGKFKFIVWLIIISIMLTGCDKPIFVQESIPTVLSTIGEKAYMEKEVALDKEIKRIVNLKVNDEGQLELVTCEEGRFSHWTLIDKQWSKINDRRFEGIYAKNSIAQMANNKEETKLLFQGEENKYVLYDIREGQPPKAIPIEFYEEIPEDHTVYSMNLLENGDLVLGYADRLIYYDGKTYAKKQEREVEVEYNGVVGYKDDIYYIDKQGDLQNIPSKNSKQMAPININKGKILYMTVSRQDEALLILTDKGLYKYIIGGSVLEEVINAKNNSLSLVVPRAYRLVEDLKGRFYVAFLDYNIEQVYLKQYVYDEVEKGEIKEEEITEITFYTMESSYYLDNLVANFNHKYPAIHVNYEVGIPENKTPGLTPWAQMSQKRMDAITNFNNSLLAGKGPDVMLLDFLPMESMMEKDVLLDLSEFIDEQIEKGNIYPTIAKTYEKDGKILALPTFFTLMIMIGDEDFIGEAKDLTSFADKVEALYAHSDKPNISGMNIWEAVVEMFYMTCAPAWQEADGSMDYGKIESFIRDTKRITDVALGDKYILDFSIYGHTDWIEELSEVSVGILSGPTDMSIIEEGFKNRDGQISYLAGQIENAYVPSKILGVNATSTKQEAIHTFLEYVLSEECQKFDYGNGMKPFPINKKVNDNGKDLPNLFAYQGGKGEIETGSGRILEYSWPSEETFQRVNSLIGEAKTPANVDLVLRDLIINEARPYYENEASLEEVMEKVKNKVGFYLVE